MSLPPFLQGIQGRDPQLAEAVDKLWETAHDGPLDEKTQLLIMMTLDTVSGAAGGVASLSAQARRAGATDAEIAHALRLAYLVSGVHALLTGNAAFEDQPR